MIQGSRKKRGRPKLASERLRTSILAMRVSRDEAEKVVKDAEESGRTVSQQIRFVYFRKVTEEP